VPKDEMIKESKIVYAQNSGTATDYKASVSWTDGTKAAGSSTFFYHADVSITIPVQLEKGKTTVTLFATGWNCSYALLVRDVNGNIVNAHQGAYKNGGNSVASRIAVTVNAEQAGEYSFVLMKSAGEGNIGWAAVAVSGANDFEPERAVINLALNAETEIVLKGTGTAPSVSYVSADSTVAEVDANGNVTAKKIGNTVITATCMKEGEEERVCSRNNAHKETRVIEKLAHSVSSLITVNPTCTEEGLSYKESTVCHSKLETEILAATGHVSNTDYVFDGVSHYKTCKNCEEVIEYSPHDWKDNACITCGYDAGGLKGLEWTLNDDKSSYSVRGIGSETSTELVIPDSHNGKPVTGIAANAFAAIPVTGLPLWESGITSSVEVSLPMPRTEYELLSSLSVHSSPFNPPASYPQVIQALSFQS